MQPPDGSRLGCEQADAAPAGAKPDRAEGVMSRRELLTEDERTQLFGVPVDEASLARHDTLSRNRAGERLGNNAAKPAAPTRKV